MKHSMIPLLLLIVGTSFPGTVLGETKPAIPRSGSYCPTGYYKSSDYCIKSRDTAHTAIQRNGNYCPSGYYKSGDYCVASSTESKKTAIKREGNSCPNGYYKSGDYCMQSK